VASALAILVSVRFGDSVSTFGRNLAEPSSFMAIRAQNRREVRIQSDLAIRLDGMGANLGIEIGKKKTATRKRIFVRTIAGAYSRSSDAGHIGVRVFGAQRVLQMFSRHAKTALASPPCLAPPWRDPELNMRVR
jgi:hypothetical protein